MQRLSVLSSFCEQGRRLLKDEDAPTMTEYALLMGLIALIAAAGVAFFGLGVSELFEVPPQYWGP